MKGSHHFIGNDIDLKKMSKYDNKIMRTAAPVLKNHRSSDNDIKGKSCSMSSPNKHKMIVCSH